MGARHDEHSSLIKTPKQLIVVVILSFVVPIAAFVLLSQLVTTGPSISPTSAAMSNAATVARLKPVGEIGAIADQNAARVERTGEEVAKSACAACHTTGAMNAPKIGDANAWRPRIATSLKKLIANAQKGIVRNGVITMPARGGNPNLSDTEITRAVVYMANQSGANFKEPKK